MLSLLPFVISCPQLPLTFVDQKTSDLVGIAYQGDNMVAVRNSREIPFRRWEYPTDEGNWTMAFGKIHAKFDVIEMYSGFVRNGSIDKECNVNWHRDPEDMWTPIDGEEYFDEKAADGTYDYDSYATPEPSPGPDTPSSMSKAYMKYLYDTPNRLQRLFI